MKPIKEDAEGQSEVVAPPIVNSLAEISRMQKNNHILLEVLANDEFQSIELRLRAITKRSNNTVMDRVRKSLRYILTGKFEAEYVISISGVKEINDSLNTVRSIAYSVKKQIDKWRWKL